MKFQLFLLLVISFLFSCKTKNNKDAIFSSADIKSTIQHTDQLIENYQTDSAIIILKKLADNTSKQKNFGNYIIVQLNLGKVYGDRGENVEALKHYQDALNTAEQIQDNDKIAHILKNIGILYVQWKKFDKALEYYEKAEGLARQNNDLELIADCQNNKGIIYEQQESYEKALIAYREALTLYSSKNIPEKIAMAYSNMAIVYKLQKNYPMSIQYNLKAIAILEKTKDKWSIAATYNNIGNLYGEMGDYEQAINYCQESLVIAKEIEAQEIIGMAYESMADAAAKFGDYKNAFQYHKLFSESMNKFINSESTRQLSELNIKYETEKKEKQIIQTLLASKQKNIWLILMGGGILVSLIIFRNFTIKARHTQKQLSLENDLLKEQTYSKMQEQRLEISRDLHDSLGAQLTFINLMLDGLKNSSTKSEETVNNKINILSDISENSMAELKNTLWVLNSSEIYLHDLKSKILNFIKNASEAKEDLRFNFHFEAEDDFNLSSRQAVNLFRTIQETINNSMKYAQATEIKIDVQQHEGSLKIKITDNGKGFDFEKEKKKSYGLNNIQSRIEEINGKMTIKTELGKGVEYNIQIPLI